MRKLLLLFLTTILIFSFVSCFPRYEIESPELYTVAVNSLLWNLGCSFGADFPTAPEITVVETDEYGRILFQYTEKYFSTEVAFSSLLVLQKEENGFVYYYEDQNFICQEKTSYNVAVVFEETLVENLKKQNDWNTPLNLEKCITKAIVDEKPAITVSDDVLDEIFSSYNGYYNNKPFVLTDDGFGKTLLYAQVILKSEDVWQAKYVVVMLENGSFIALFEPESLYNYQVELQAFKDNNSWGTYSEGG